jgi:hypothetical protein
MASTEVKLVMLGDTVSTTVDPVMSTMVAGDVASMTIGTAMSMMVVDAVSTSMPIGGAESMAVADDEPSTLVGVERSAMVSEGADESVDPDPVIPTVGAN